MTEAIANIAPMSISDYLSREDKSLERHEYHDGEVLAMAGGTPTHSLISANFVREAGNQLRGKPCAVYSSDSRVYIPPSRRFVYPDAFVVCGPLEVSTQDENAVVNPRLVLEVLSESSAAYDRGEKFEHYLKLPSFQCYILIEQSKPYVEVLTRKSEGMWLHAIYNDIAQFAGIPTLELSIPLAEIYANVNFEKSKKSQQDQS